MIAIQMSGNMTGATNKIEKIKKGLSKDKKVVNALRLANESVDEKINKDDKIQVRGVGMYTYATLKSTLQDKAKDLFKQAKGEKWSRVSRGGLRAMAEMWDAMAKYDRTH